MNGPRIASLFSGTGALDLAVMDVYGGAVVWHSQYEPPDKHGKPDTVQFAARILARHWPDSPNLGDITKVDWQQVLDEHGPIDILTGGFPCQDVSSAGRRAGIAEGTRSGLWAHFARAIHELRPRLVVIENVEGLLSAKASGDMEPCPHCVGDGSAEPSLRALGAVLGDLASLGFDAEWARVAASEVGAAHGRKRVFILAWPTAADTQDDGHERPGSARGRRPGSADRDLAAADADRHGLQGQRGDTGPLPERSAAPAVGCGSTGGHLPAADADGGRLQGHGELSTGRDALRQRLRHDAHGRGPTPSDAQGVGRGQGRPEPARLVRGPDAPLSGGETAADADRFGWRANILDLRPGQPDLDWGDYGPAVRRWEHVFGRPAPWPTDVRGRLTPVFSEWMQGYPDGWVTCTPGPEGMSPPALRNAMLRALGNGVVRLQAAVAIRHLHQRAGLTTRPAVVPAAA